jgi:hypothetical protein
LANVAYKNAMSAESSLPKEQSTDWRQLYQAAMLGTDESKLRGRIECAEAAINASLKTLSAELEHTDEKQAIAVALRNLNVLKR